MQCSFGTNVELAMVLKLILVCSFVVLIQSAMIDEDLSKIPLESFNDANEAREAVLRVRRDMSESLSEFRKEEYERRLLESLNILRSVPVTRLYVPEYGHGEAFNIDIGTVIGKVRKLFPYGKQLIVWPYLGYRNFTLDELTGEVRTMARLDFEQVKQYNITIRDFRYNYSDPEPLRSPAIPHPWSDDPKRDYIDHYLIVEVVDRNDNEPKFTRDRTDGGKLSGVVDKNAGAGTAALYVHAVDEDSGPRGVVRFNIRTENKKQPKFTVDPNTHYLKTAGFKLPDGVYPVNVEALDCGMPPKSSGFQSFTVRVGKTPPEFVGLPYNFSFSESKVRGRVVAKVQAISRPGIPIEYQIITDNVKDTFAINHFGEITLLRELDYDGASNADKPFRFTVRAFEDSFTGRDQNASVQLKFVRVDDRLVKFKANDTNSPPSFPDQPYIGYIKENKPVGTFVRYINAIDHDNPDINDGKNVKLNYELVTNTGKESLDSDGKLFELDSDGRLVTKVKIDNEEFRRNLSIRVRAWDGGTPRLYRETDVTIVIRDQSEYQPSFQKAFYDATVSETSPPGFVVLKLTIDVYDFAPLTPPALSMVSGNYPYAFDINQETGEIVVSGVLDADKRVYNLTIGLMERSGNGRKFWPGRSTYYISTSVFISVMPRNNHAPTFTKVDKNFTTTIPEDTPVGTKLDLGIEVQDKDKDVRQQFKIFIKTGNIGDWFGVEVDSNKAYIVIQYPLDREFKDVYEMQLVVMDSGGLSDTAWLRITLTDKNDNPPRFLSSYYTGTVREGLCDDSTPLVMISVTDDDLPEQGPFAFEFAPGGNPGNQFELRNTTTNTTKLYCSGSIDRESTPDLKVVIKVADNPPPKLSSTANIFIHVDDIDEFDESSARMKVIVNAVDGYFSGGPIAKTYFQDKDGDSAITGMTYSLTGSDQFSVDHHGGWINAKTTVRAGNYEVKVTGRKGSFRPSCTVEVTVRDVSSKAISNSAAIQFQEVTHVSRFLNPIRQGTTNHFESITYYDRFVDMLSEMFNVSTSNVYVFSVQTSKKANQGRHYPAIDVHFAIEKDSSAKSSFLPRYVLINMLEKNTDILRNLGLKLGVIGLDYCAQETVKSGMCRNVIRRLGDEYSVVTSDYGLLPVPDYAVAMTSVKVVADSEYDRYHPDPDPEYDSCTALSCLNGGICHDVVPRGFECECSWKESGPRCQFTARTFFGNSYIWLSPIIPHEFGGVSLEFATDSGSGLLLYQGPAVRDGNNGHKDFLAISLKDGRIRVGVSFGGNPQVMTMDKGPKLNDGKWHHIEVSHQRKEVKLTIDHCSYADVTEDNKNIGRIRENCEMITQTIQNYQFLNGLAPVQIGGVELVPLMKYPASDVIEYTHFTGCIRKIKANLEMYDLAYPLKIVNASIGVSNCTAGKVNEECGEYLSPTTVTSATVTSTVIPDDSSSSWIFINTFTILAACLLSMYSAVP